MSDDLTPLAGRAPAGAAGRMIVLRPGTPGLPAYTDADYSISEATAGELTAATPENTARAYGHAWGEFSRWCAGGPHRPPSHRAHPRRVRPGPGLRRAGPRYRRAGDRRDPSRHRKAGYKEQPRTEEALGLLRGYRVAWARQGNRVSQRTPILLPQLRAMVATCDPATEAGTRDRALLLLGFNIMARRSELAARDQGDIIDHGEEGIGVFIAFSKTDRDARGLGAGARREHEATCAVRALRAWTGLLASRGLACGALFRPVDRHGKIGGEPSTAAKAATRLTGKGVDLIVRRRALLAGLSSDGDWGSHGLRAGAATAAYAAGAPVSSIAAQGRWSPKSTTLLSYIRAVDQWNDHPMKGLAYDRACRRRTLQAASDRQPTGTTSWPSAHTGTVSGVSGATAASSPPRKVRCGSTVPRAGWSEVFDVACGDVVWWVGVQAQLAVVGVAEAPIELGAVVSRGFRGVRVASGQFCRISLNSDYQPLTCAARPSHRTRAAGQFESRRYCGSVGQAIALTSSRGISPVRSAMTPCSISLTCRGNSHAGRNTRT